MKFLRWTNGGSDTYKLVRTDSDLLKVMSHVLISVAGLSMILVDACHNMSEHVPTRKSRDGLNKTSL